MKYFTILLRIGKRNSLRKLCSFLKAKAARKSILLVIGFIFFANLSFSQITDSTKRIGHFSGSIGITNNGISFIPTFSLGEPAAIFIFSVGKRRLSFEPDIRFTLDARRGGMAFWWRYKLLRKNKFKVNAGAHPALNFLNKTVT